MQIIGFNFTKISAFKSPEFKRSSLNTNMTFLDIKEEKFSLLNTKAQKVSFRFSIEYESPETKETKEEPQETQEKQESKSEKKEKSEKAPEKAKEKKEEPKEEKKPLEAEIAFEGEIILSVSEKEAEEIQKSWKKKEFPAQFNVFLFNTILKRCSLKALQIEDELNLPNHIPLPSLKAEPKK